MWAWVKLDPTALQYVALSPNAKDMAENMFRALWSWIVCVHRDRGGQLHDQAEAGSRTRTNLVYRLHGHSRRKAIFPCGSGPIFLGLHCGLTAIFIALEHYLLVHRYGEGL